MARDSMYPSAVRWLTLLVIVAGCGKNVVRDQALARANEARARGDVVGEALALRDACAAAPDEEDLCRRAVAAWQAAQAHSRQTAAAACTGVAPTLDAVDACLAAVAKIRSLTPGDPDAARFADAAARQHLARCFADSPAWQTELGAAVELVRCEEARAVQIDLPTYTQQIWSARTNARDQLLRLAEHPSYERRPGARAELLGAATCLTATPDLIARARASRGELVSGFRGSIDLRVASALPGLCPAAASLLGDRAVCGAPRPGAPRITIVGEVEIAPVEHAAYETTESKEYVAGIIRFENPDYQPAVNDERSARMAKERAESQYRRDEADCRSAESALSSQSSSCGTSCPARDERDRACNRKSASESLYRSREREWDDARRRLSSTPAISEREDIRTAHYTVRHHTWRAAWSARLRSDGRTFTVGGETQTTDRETRGAPVAGVPADPRTYPGSRWFVPPIRDQVAARLAETIDVALKRRASDLAVSCPVPLRWTSEWLDCWARVRFWGGEPADPLALFALIGERSAWAPLRCAP